VKKAVIFLSVLVVLAIGGVIALAVYVLNTRAPQGRIAENPPILSPQEQPPDDESAAMAEELADLFDILDALLAEQDTDAPVEPELISAQQAAAVALEHIGHHGEPSNILLFSDYGVLTFEVDIRQGITRYMVYIDAVSGVVLSMGIFEDVFVYE